MMLPLRIAAMDVRRSVFARHVGRVGSRSLVMPGLACHGIVSVCGVIDRPKWARRR